MDDTRPSFTLGPLEAMPGTKVSGFLEVPAPRAEDEATRIPVTLVHGARPGPVLALIAGTHGAEYPPILALQRVRRTIDAQALAGTLILVHIANLPSFQLRTVYYGPTDGRNLNRVYPGRPDGTMSERIAHVITTQVIADADYVADLHCGDANEALRPYSYWFVSGDARVDEASKAMAVAFGVDWIVIDDSRPTDPEASMYTANTAITRGKPAITTETGELGSSDERWVAQAERGAWNLLHHFGMIDGHPVLSGEVVWLQPSEVLRSPVTGMFRSVVRAGEPVSKNAVLGVLTDWFGEVLREVRAPFEGVVTYIVETPPVTAGEPLAMIGTPRSG